METDLSELKKLVEQRVNEVEQRLSQSFLPQSQALGERVERLEAEIKVIRPAVEKMAKYLSAQAK